MKWSHYELAQLALPSCSVCEGTGVREGREGGPAPCKCASRQMFRVCYARFRGCVEASKFSRVSFDRTPSGRTNRGMWGRKDEEYMADFTLVARRVLDEFHYRIFRYHFLLGADWKLCRRHVGISRGMFFHAVYRVEAMLGETFASLEPYALYPPRDYFGVRLASGVAACDPADTAGLRQPQLQSRPADSLYWERIPA